MSLNDKERLILDLMAAWQKDHPKEFGITLMELATDLEIVSSAIAPAADGITTVVLPETWAKETSAMLVSLETRGLIDRDGGYYRAKGLLDRLAAEVSD